MSGKSTEDLFSANFQYMIYLFSTALFRNYFSLEDDCFTVLCVSAINGHEAAVDMPQSPDSCTSLSLPHTIPPPHPITPPHPIPAHPCRLSQSPTPL